MNRRRGEPGRFILAFRLLCERNNTVVSCWSLCLLYCWDWLTFSCLWWAHFDSVSRLLVRQSVWLDEDFEVSIRNQPSAAAVQSQTTEVVLGYYLSPIPLHIACCGFVTADKCFWQSHNNSAAVFWIWAVCMGEVCNFQKSPNGTDLTKSAAETVLYFLYMLLPVSLQRSWIYTFLKNPAAQAKIQRGIKVLQCFCLLYTREAIMICRPSYGFITINGGAASIYYNLRFVFF